MKKISFGIKAELYNGQDDNDFEVYSQQAGEGGPYGKNYFARQENMPNPNLDPNLRITSIPSPYARMHLTDLAFEELSMLDLDNSKLSVDYQKAISHCLDIFEMFFRFDKLDLLEKGIKIERIELVSGRFGQQGKWQNFLNANPNVKNYIETLDLFRQQYLNILSRHGNNNFKFQFTDMYVFKDRRGQTFAATSPFTGFYTTSNCDLTQYNIDFNNQHKLLTSNPLDWKMLSQRGQDFQEFMYVLLNPENEGGLGNVFTNLFSVVEKTIGQQKVNELNNKKFSEEYPEYNFTPSDLPQIKTADGSVRYLRSSDLDRSYLKYLLFFKQGEPVNFAIDKALYNTPIEQRKFPDDNGKSCYWMGVNDFLSDALFVLPYDISDDYVGVEYEDDNNQKRKRCLVPIKADALRYLGILNQEQANDRISIHKYSDGHYSVSLKIDILDGAPTQTQITIRREYWHGQYDDKLQIKGRVYEADELDNFAFGIYPFVKSDTEINIYKVLFYNQLKGKVSDGSFNVKFYYRDANGNTMCYISNVNGLVTTGGGAGINSSCIYNYTSEYDSQRNTINNIYYNLETDVAGIGIDFVEFSICDENTSITNRITGTALIIPILSQPQNLNAQGGETRIAIDLGTSNTYIAYQHETDPIREINMVDANGKAELRFMHKQTSPNTFNLSPKYEHDLCIQPSEQSIIGKQNEEIKNLWLKNIPTQLCEFIPTHIMENDPRNINKAFMFPIPTLISYLRHNGNNNHSTLIIQNNQPLIHSTIPFAYYDIGKRRQDNAPKSNFKWLINPNTTFVETDNENSLTLFISELLFIVRSHMLYNGYNLSNCKIIWTYPLAFLYDDSDRLRGTTKTIWQRQYLRYFQTDGNNFANPANYNKTVAGRSEPITIDDLVLNTNESLSPFYYQLAGGNSYQLLLDIGGGSTDVLGYKGGDLKFISSFEFAGNDLYLKKERNDGRNQLPDESNIVVKSFNGLRQQYGDSMSQTDFNDCVRINNATDINSFMNYGFQKFSNHFNGLWQRDDLRFLLTFHLGAILYQTVQLSNNFFEGVIPEKIRFTGNGSKLFSLIPEMRRNRLIKCILASILNHNESDITTQQSTVINPKFAAAQGCLQGFDRIFNVTATTDVQNKSFIALGDGKVYKNVFDRRINSQADNDTLKQQVYDNVKSYIDLIYSIYEGENMPVSKDYLLHYLEAETSNDPTITLENGFNNLFFQYIISLMEGISIKLC